MTIKVVMKFVSSENEIELGFTYVGMSRNLACEQTDICPCCSLEKLTSKISSGSTLKVRSNVPSDNCRDFYSDNQVYTCN